VKDRMSQKDNPKGGNMEVFPDLHHKMSKKIAQLTKVIYHLNTKNEDHQIEVEQLTANHQMEVQQILRDAANRISKFKDAIESKQQSVSLLLMFSFSFIFFLPSRLIMKHKSKN
jgi:gas vesicle protein